MLKCLNKKFLFYASVYAYVASENLRLKYVHSFINSFINMKCDLTL